MAVEAEPKGEVGEVQADQEEPGRRSWSRGQMVVLALAVVGLVAVFVLTRGDDDAPAEEVGPVAGAMNDRYSTYIDEETGFSFAHPETWIPVSRPEGTQRVVLSAGGDNTVSVRYNQNEQAVVTVEDLEKVRETTDRIAGPEGVQVLKREALMLNDMPTLYYLSRFTDEASGAKGVNAQHFVFQGTNMYILLFQAFPEEEFDRLAPDFDKIRATFNGDPDYEPPATDDSAPETPPTSAEG